MTNKINDDNNLAPFANVRPWVAHAWGVTTQSVWPCRFNSEVALPDLDLRPDLEPLARPEVESWELEPLPLFEESNRWGIAGMALFTLMWFCFAIRVGSMMPRVGIDLLALWELSFFTGVVLGVDCLAWFVLAGIMRRTR